MKFLLYIIAFVVYTSLNAASVDVVKIQLEFNQKKIILIKKIFTDSVKKYEHGITTYNDIVFLHNHLYKLKHTILKEKHFIKNRLFTPEKDLSYLNEKLDLHKQDLQFYKISIQVFEQLIQNDSVEDFNIQLFKLNLKDAYASFKVTSLLYEINNNKKVISFDRLLQKVDNLNIVKKDTLRKDSLEDGEEVQYASGDESPNSKLELLDYILD